MESGLIVALATAVFSIVSVFLGAKCRKLLSRGRLFAELFDDFFAAAEDDKVSEEGFHEIVGKAKKVAVQVEELLLNWKLFLSAVFVSWQEKELLTKKNC